MVGIRAQVLEWSWQLPTLLGRQALYLLIAAAFVAGLSRLTRRWPALWHLGLWYLVLIRLLLPLDLASPLSGRALLDRALHVPVIAHWLAQFQSTPDGAGQPADSLPYSADANLLSAGNAQPLPASFTWRSITSALWLLGAVFFFTRAGMARYRVHRQLRDCLPLTDPLWQTQLQNEAALLRLRRPVRLLQGTASGPFTVGWWRPAILIPQDWLSTTGSSARRAILVHELLHIQRGDALWLILETGIQALYFFHPLVWIARCRIDLYRECHIDHKVLTHTRLTAYEYAYSLLSGLHQRQHSRSFAAGHSFYRNPNHLSNRLKMLKGGSRMSRFERLIALMLSAVGLLLLPMANAQTPPPGGTLAEKTITWTCPLVNGHISSAFGPRIHPITGKENFHNAVDISAPRGTDIYAAADGVVTLAKLDHEPGKGYGRNLIVQHDDVWQTRYAQLDTLFVVEGQQVKAGQTIAQVGSSGISTGPHLHFELIRNGEYTDPQQRIDFSNLAN